MCFAHDVSVIRAYVFQSKLSEQQVMPNIEVTLKPQKGVNNYGADKCKKQKFEEDGYIIVPNLLTQEEVEVVRQRADLNASGGVTPEPGWAIQVEPSIQRGEEAAKSRVESIHKLGGLVRTDPVMNAHATNPKIVDIMADLLGPDTKLLGDQLFMKSSMHGSHKNFTRIRSRGNTLLGSLARNVRGKSNRRHFRARWKMRCLSS